VTVTNPGGGWPTGATQVAAVIGHPVGHSLSPAIHNAAFAACGLDWAYLAFDVSEEEAAAALAAASALGIRGLSVTMPLKAVVAAAVDRLTEAARTLGAVNTVVFGADGALGDNTDGPGFVASLAEVGWDPAGRRCVVLGAGGAARAVILALAEAGADDIAVLNRGHDRAATAASVAGKVGRVGSPGDVPTADLVVNATPVGMAGTATSGRSSVDPDLLRAGQLVADLVYHPRQTPLLVAAARRGAATVDGVGMLVRQAALQFSMWTGAEAPVQVMGAAARAALDDSRPEV
jgi:shikimate dehydrogenase